MLTVAIVSLAATVSIPLMTKAVIDGPVRHQDQRGLWLLGLVAMGVGFTEAVLWFVRRWLISRATMGVEADIRKDLYARASDTADVLPRPLAVGPAAVADHERPGHHAPVPRLRPAVHRDERRADRRGHRPADNMYWPLGAGRARLDRAHHLDSCLRNERAYTRLSRKIQDQAGDVASTVEEGAYGLRVIKSFGRAAHMFDTLRRAKPPSCTTPRWSASAESRSSGPSSRSSRAPP